MAPLSTAAPRQSRVASPAPRKPLSAEGNFSGKENEPGNVVVAEPSEPAKPTQAAQAPVRPAAKVTTVQRAKQLVEQVAKPLLLLSALLVVALLLPAWHPVVDDGMVSAAAARLPVAGACTAAAAALALAIQRLAPWAATSAAPALPLRRLVQRVRAAWKRRQ
mmetsp:Transcript_52429/g.121909  ORF Transcript_52429/g.121909 Transcript_52429/m.121909 type:complete len:163 (-) Transcript_52429:205-693(-)|eukprot:CAMPEP_0171131952 /NCGR_PEP_ID=MMETSP0766_2-20121228/123627_1 /TAXON_ID=439317 /ORGANISM="Gambierdiscus australes, Strain CAWD 149" /LENGTH=162 /DNA_ID=CAMNT_0011595271 /DNA_START=33 /DNA_END=521 /DNA_ORIENTATION=+